MPFLDPQCWYEIYDGSSPSSAEIPAVFLDRDGVIIVEKHYLRDPEQVELYPGVAEKLESLSRLKVAIVLVTNQSGIGQGLFGWADYNLVHQRMIELLNQRQRRVEGEAPAALPMEGATRAPLTTQPFTAVYANAHRPDETEASWRKPNPGMILQAAADRNIRLESSVMVGDKWVDMEAAFRAGVRHLVHVKTGHGARERPTVIERYPRAELIDSLADLDLEMFGISK